MSSSHTQGFDHNFWSWWDFNKRKTILQSPFPVVVFWGRKKKHNSTMQIQNLGVCLKTKFIHFFFVWSISMLSSGRHILDLSGFQFSPLEYWWIPYSWWSGTLLLSINCVIRSPCLICNLVVPQIHKESRKESASFPYTTYKSGKKLLNNHFCQKSFILSVFLCFSLNIINDCVFFLFCLLFV